MNSSPLSKGSPLSSPTVRDVLDKDGKDNGSIKDLKEKETSSDKDTSTFSIRRVRSKKSVDTKPSDRMSLFASFGGKSRKPPPMFVSLSCFH